MWKYITKIITLVIVTIPLTCHADALTSTDIDRYLKSYPAVTDLLGQITKKIKKDDNVNTQIAVAQMEGRMHRKMAGIIGGWPEQVTLMEVLQKQGFKSIEDWALVADRISGVVMASTWVMAATAMGNNNKPLREDLNLFAYLDDKKNDAALREKYRGQLDEMCDRLCYDKADIKIVRGKYAEIASVLK